MEAEAPKIRVEVAYGLPDRQRVIELELPPGTSALEAVRLSGICGEFAAIDLAANPIGIFGRLLSDPQNHLLQSGDRIEIYRPLVVDPKEARRLRAATKPRS